MMKRVLCVRLPDWPRQRHSVVPQELELSDGEALAYLVPWCEQFSPSVGVDTFQPAESLLLDVTGLAGLFHGEEALVAHVEREFGRRGLVTRLALADTVGAAWALAHYGEIANCKLQIANCKFGEVPRHDDALTSATTAIENLQFALAVGGTSQGNLQSPIIVPAGQTLVALSPLPVEALRLTPDCVEILRELGLRQIGQLLPFSRDDLTTRFGPQLLWRLDQATGEVDEVIAACHPAPQVEVEWTFEHPTDRQEIIEQVLQRQLERVVRELIPRQQGVQELVCRLRGETGKTAEITVGLYRTSASPRHLAELIEMQWETAHRKLAQPLASLSVSVTAAAALECRQQELFDDADQHYDPRQTAILVDRLSSRLGRSSVVRPRLLPEAQPELAWRYQPLVGGQKKRPGRSSSKKRSAAAVGRRNTSEGVSNRSLTRPLSLAARPLPIEVVSMAPQGPPLAFVFSGQQHRIARTWGPERIQTGWWRGPSIRRDYYRVETTTGRWFWLFRQLTDGRWYFHGSFD
jgi:protein ImuB